MQATTPTELGRNDHYAGSYLPSDAHKLAQSLDMQDGVSQSWVVEHEHLARVFFTADTDVAAAFAQSFVNGYRACLVDHEA